MKTPSPKENRSLISERFQPSYPSNLRFGGGGHRRRQPKPVLLPQAHANSLLHGAEEKKNVPTKRGRSEETRRSEPPQPAIPHSRIMNAEGLDKVRHLVGERSNEWGETRLKVAGTRDSDVIQAPIFVIFLAAGFAPRFQPSTAPFWSSTRFICSISAQMQS